MNNSVFDNNTNTNHFFNSDAYRLHMPILVEGQVEQDYAKARLDFGEYYTLVHCTKTDELPSGYILLDQAYMNSIGVDSEEQFATIDPNLRIRSISQNGGIQTVSALPAKKGEARYLLGPGPEVVSLSAMVKEQLEAYQKGKSL